MPRRAESARGGAPRAQDQFVGWIGWALFLSVVTAKIAVHPLPGTSLQSTLAILYALPAVALITGAGAIEWSRLLATLGVTAAMALASLAAGASPQSLVLVLILYLPFAVAVRFEAGQYLRMLNCWQVIACGLSVLLFADWAFQGAGLPMPNFEHLVPSKLLMPAYNYIQETAWSSGRYKPNGFFALETSYLAQYIGLALVIELCLFQRPLTLALLGSALACSFGGTGMALVAISVPLILLRMRMRTAGLFLAVAPILLVVALQTGIIDNIVTRMGEFGQSGTSGDERFNGQFRHLVLLWERPEVVFTGVGAGGMGGLHAFFSTITKLLGEYGLPVGALFLAAIVWMTAGGGTPLAVAMPLLVAFFLLNGGLAVPVNVFALFALGALPNLRRGEKVDRALLRARGMARRLESARMPAERWLVRAVWATVAGVIVFGAVDPNRSVRISAEMGRQDCALVGSC